jgi:hypothetical protein
LYPFTLLSTFCYAIAAHCFCFIVRHTSLLYYKITFKYLKLISLKEQHINIIKMNADSNGEILKLITSRMDIGLERYGHGIRINDDTRQWGTQEDSWEEMALEEILDGMVYTASAIIRLREKRKQLQS